MPFTKLTTRIRTSGRQRSQRISLRQQRRFVSPTSTATAAPWTTSACTAAARLVRGSIEGGKVVCPWHGWDWDPKTGEAAHNPNAKVAVYPLKIENGEVLIEIQRSYTGSSARIVGNFRR